MTRSDSHDNDNAGSSHHYHASSSTSSSFHGSSHHGAAYRGYSRGGAYGAARDRFRDGGRGSSEFHDDSPGFRRRESRGSPTLRGDYHHHHHHHHHAHGSSSSRRDDDWHHPSRTRSFDNGEEHGDPFLFPSSGKRKIDRWLNAKWRGFIQNISNLFFVYLLTFPSLRSLNLKNKKIVAFIESCDLKRERYFVFFPGACRVNFASIFLGKKTCIFTYFHTARIQTGPDDRDRAGKRARWSEGGDLPYDRGYDRYTSIVFCLFLFHAHIYL